jgi:hypothetical protein
MAKGQEFSWATWEVSGSTEKWEQGRRVSKDLKKEGHLRRGKDRDVEALPQWRIFFFNGVLECGSKLRTKCEWWLLARGGECEGVVGETMRA